MNKSILEFYGLSSFQEVECYSQQSDCLQWNECSLDSGIICDMLNNTNIILFISLKATKVLERRKPISLIIGQKYGVCGEIMLEHDIKTFEGTMRHCAISIQPNQIRKLLRILFEHSSNAFAIVANTNTSELSEKLLQLLESGVLTPNILTKCSNTTLHANASFLHILKGYDGYSINCFMHKDAINL